MVWVKQSDPPGTKRALLLRYVNDDDKFKSVEDIFNRAPYKGVNKVMMQVLEIGASVVLQHMKNGRTLEEALGKVENNPQLSPSSRSDDQSRPSSRSDDQSRQSQNHSGNSTPLPAASPAESDRTQGNAEMSTLNSQSESLQKPKLSPAAQSLIEMYGQDDAGKNK